MFVYNEIMDIVDNYTVTESLFVKNISEEDEQRLSSELIKNNDLPLRPEDIIGAFRNVRKQLFSPDYNNIFNRHKYVLKKLLLTNRNIYIALILALNDDFDFSDIGSLYNFVYAIKYPNIWYSGSVKICCKLLDYYNFDFDDLNIAPCYKLQIQEYANHKYGGKFTKRAVK